MSKTIKMIFAKSQNGVIGCLGNIPWKHSEDMQYFKQQTMGGTVIMGRKTWDSLPPQFRPLPGRDNIVLTRNPRFGPVGASKATSLEQAIEIADENKTIWIIGGAEIYQQAISLVSEIHVTIVHENHHGDAFAPALPGWRLESDETIYRHEDSRARIPVLTFVKLVPGEPAIKPETVSNAPSVEVWHDMSQAPQDERWLKLKGAYLTSSDVVEVIGHHVTSGETDCWKDNRGNQFIPTGWKGLND